MERNLARRLIEAVMPKDKRQAVPTIRALIDEAEIHLEHYGNQTQDVELRSPTELLQARRKISDALELSETYDLTMMGESARLIERQTSDALTFWGEQRRQLIESVLAIDEDTTPPEFNGWVEEYRLCFPDKEALISGWREQKTVLEIQERFEQDYLQTVERVTKLQDEAKALYNADPINNEGNAIGAMRRAYEAAKQLADNYIAEQAARDLAIDAKSLYEKRKETWSKSLVTSARFAQFKRVRKQWEQARRAGEEKVVPYEAVLDEDGELVFGFEDGEEILTLVEGEPVSIDDALSRLSDIEFKYADTKTNEYIRLADGQVATNPKGAVDTLEEFGTRHIDVLRATHKKRLEAKLQEYQDRLDRRQRAERLLEKARTEASAIEAWRFVLKAESLDGNVPGLANAKAEIGRQLQVVIEQKVLPEYQKIGILEHEGDKSWDNQIAYLSVLQSLIADYEPLEQSYNKLGRIIDELGDFRDLDVEINETLPEIRAKLRDAPDEADDELEALEYRLIKHQRAALYPAIQNMRQQINTHLNINGQKRVWLDEIDDDNRLLHNLAAIETAVEEFAHLEDEELDRIHKRYQARAMLRELETDKEYGLLSEGLQAEVEAIDTINSLLQEADETDAQLIAKVSNLSRWLNQKKRDYDEIVKQLPPLVEKIENRDYVAADSMLDILFGLYPDDPTLIQRKNQMEVEWKIYLMEELTRRALDLDRVRNGLAPSELRNILNDIDKLQDLSGEGVVSRFRELRACCYLGLARAEPKQKRYWLREAERIAPEASIAYGHVRAELNELQREDDFSELAGESDEQKRMLRLEKMRVRYPNDIEILELLADLYLKRGEPLKAQGMVQHLMILQRRGEIGSLDIDVLETQIEDLIKVQDWKRLVVEQLDPEASLERLKAANDDLIREIPLKPASSNYQALEQWYEAQKRDFASVLLRQAKDLRDRDADLVDVCEKMVQVWMFVPQSREAKDALEELGQYSLDLQRELEQETKDTSGKVMDAPDWLNQQIRRADRLIVEAKKVSKVLEIYYERSGDAEQRREKSVSLREQIEALTNHKRDLGRLRTELAVLQSEWREVRESRNPNDRRWDSLERRVNSLQTGTSEYAGLKHLRQHEQVKFFFNLIMKSRGDQRRLKGLFEELERSVDDGLDQAALGLTGEIRSVEDWERYRFEDDLGDMQTVSTPITLASLEVVLLERTKLLDEVNERIATHTRRLPHWKETYGLWVTPDRERLLNHPEMTDVLQKLRSHQEREVHDAVETYRRMLKEIHADHSMPPSEVGQTVQRAMRESLRAGKWEEAIIHCWRAAFNEPKHEARLQEELRRLKNEANANNNPGPFVRRVKQIAGSIASPGESDLAALGSWHYFLKLTESFPLILPEEASNPRMALELAHMEMIRSDVVAWLDEAKNEIDGVANLFRQFITHYIVAQQSLDSVGSLRWRMFRRRELDRIATSGQLAYNECRRICPDYPYPQALRDRFE